MDSDVIARTAIKTFYRLMDVWRIDEAQWPILWGGPIPPLESAIGEGAPPVLEDTTLLRMSYLLGIYAALVQLLGGSAPMARWLRAANTAPLFGGRPALELMLTGGMDGLRRTREYLDGQLHGS